MSGRGKFFFPGTGSHYPLSGLLFNARGNPLGSHGAFHPPAPSGIWSLRSGGVGPCPVPCLGRTGAKRAFQPAPGWVSSAGQWVAVPHGNHLLSFVGSGSAQLHRAQALFGGPANLDPPGVGGVLSPAFGTVGAPASGAGETVFPSGAAGGELPAGQRFPGAFPGLSFPRGYLCPRGCCGSGGEPGADPVSLAGGGSILDGGHLCPVPGFFWTWTTLLWEPGGWRPSGLF